MKTQNIILYLFVIGLVLSSTKAFAVTVTIPDVEGNKCETITVPINIDDKTNIVSIDFIVDYDDGVLTATEAGTTNLTPSAADGWLIAYKITSGRIKITIINSEEPTGNGAIVEIDFTVASSANVGNTSPLTLTQALVNEGAINSTLVSGTFTVINKNPEVVDLTVSSSEVFRTQSVTVISNADDCEDNEGNLTCEMQYRAPSGSWVDLSGETFVTNHWEGTFAPAQTAELGTYDFRVRYTDTHAGESGWYEKLDILTVKNNLPTAEITVCPQSGTACEPITLQGVGSDVETSALTLKWDLDGDNQYDDRTGATITWTYNDYGPHTASLQVTDANGGVATDGCQIIIDLSFGDVSGNCSVSGYDGALILQHLVGLIALDEYQEKAGDVNESGDLGAMDASLIIQYVVGIIDKLPIEAAPAMNITPRSYHLTMPFPIARSGGNITVPIIVNDTTGLLSGQLILTYDANILTPLNVSKTALTKNFFLEHNAVDNCLNIAFAGANIDSDKGAVFNIEFKVSPNAAGSNFNPINISQVNFNELSKVSVQNGTLEILPAYTKVLQNYPNPFNPETWIPYQLAQDAPVTISIYNTKGQLLRTLHLGNQNAGIYMAKDKAAYWDGKDDLGQKVASGVYYYTLQVGNFISTRKMVILK